MLSMKRVFLYLITALSVTACGSMANGHAPELLSDTAPSATGGVVILSTGAKEKCSSAATFLKVVRADQPYNKEFMLLGVDGWTLKSDFSDHQGNIHALYLVPGRYYLAPWFANPYLTPTRIPKFDFVVNANEVSYLGEYFLKIQCGGSTLGVINDEEKRDLQMVKARKPKLNLDSVRKAIATATGLAVGE
jgi:hypothetical protein